VSQNRTDDLKTELQTIYTKKRNVAKCRWMEKGDCPTKHLFNLERRNYNKKTISELRMEDETIIKNQTQVLDAIEKYFNDLYTSASSATQEEYDIPLFRNCTFLSFLMKSIMNSKAPKCTTNVNRF